MKNDDLFSADTQGEDGVKMKTDIFTLNAPFVHRCCERFGEDEDEIRKKNFVGENKTALLPI